MFGCPVGIECFLIFGWETHPRNKKSLRYANSEPDGDSYSREYMKMEIDIRTSPRIAVYLRRER